MYSRSFKTYGKRRFHVPVVRDFAHQSWDISPIKASPVRSRPHKPISAISISSDDSDEEEEDEEGVVESHYPSGRAKRPIKKDRAKEKAMKELMKRREAKSPVKGKRVGGGGAEFGLGRMASSAGIGLGEKRGKAAKSKVTIELLDSDDEEHQWPSKRKSFETNTKGEEDKPVRNDMVWEEGDSSIELIDPPLATHSQPQPMNSSPFSKPDQSKQQPKPLFRDLSPSGSSSSMRSLPRRRPVRRIVSAQSNLDDHKEDKENQTQRRGGGARRPGKGRKPPSKFVIPSPEASVDGPELVEALENLSMVDGTRSQPKIQLQPEPELETAAPKPRLQPQPQPQPHPPPAVTTEKPTSSSSLASKPASSTTLRNKSTQGSKSGERLPLQSKDTNIATKPPNSKSSVSTGGKLGEKGKGKEKTTALELEPIGQVVEKPSSKGNVAPAPVEQVEPQPQLQPQVEKQEQLFPVEGVKEVKTSSRPNDMQHQSQAPDLSEHVTSVLGSLPSTSTSNPTPSLNETFFPTAKPSTTQIPPLLLPLFQLCTNVSRFEQPVWVKEKAYDFDSILPKKNDNDNGHDDGDNDGWRKISEASYSEVYCHHFPSLDSEASTVIKVIPITPVKPSLRRGGGKRRKVEEEETETPETSDWDAVMREIRITQSVDGLDGFVGLKGACITSGVYPPALLDEWDRFEGQYPDRCLNVRPDSFTPSQFYAVLFLGHGGKDLETVRLSSWEETFSILWQVSHSLAQAESSRKFETRDLHWGNILVKPMSMDEQLAAATMSSMRITDGNGNENDDEGGATTTPFRPTVKTTIIDFTLSRAEADEGDTMFGGIEKEVFEGEGDMQYDVYRWMRSIANNDWSHYYPITNILWLRYLTDKLLHSKSLRPPAALLATPQKPKTSKRRQPKPRPSRQALELEGMFHHALVTADQILAETTELAIGDRMESKAKKKTKTRGTRNKGRIEVASAGQFSLWLRRNCKRMVS